MLTAFTPHPALELKSRDKSKIEAILAYGDRLLVGLNTGHLRVYRFNEIQELPEIERESDEQPAPQQTKDRVVELLREEDKFSRKPVQQLAIIKEASILISLSDGYVSFYDLQTFTLSERLEKTKGATMFAVTSNIVKDPNSGIPSIESRLAVAVKRKIIIWTWRDMELTGSAEEISLTASLKSMTWSTGTKIVAGLDPGFVVVDVESRQVSDVNRPQLPGEAASTAGVRFGATNVPKVSGIGYMGMGSWIPKPMATKLSDGQLLLARDVNTLFIDAEGKPIEKRQIPWAAPPEAIGYSYPYMLALQQPNRGVLEIRNPDTLSLLQTISLPNATLLHVPQPYISLAHAGKGFLVASDRVIWRMGANGYKSQIDELLRKSHFDEAISLVNLLEDTLLLDKQARLREIRILKANWLFRQQRYRDSLDLFTSAQAPPAIVVSLFPETIAGTISEHRRPESRNNAAGGDSKNGEKSSVTPGRLEGRDLTLAVNELRGFLAQARVQLQKYINYDGSLKQGALENRSAYEHLLTKPVQDDKGCREGLLETAALVDTTLFRAYMLVSPSLAGSLFRLDNFCSPEVVEEKLYETGRYADLIDFLHGKRLHQEALDMLAKFGKEEGDAHASEGFKGPERTVRYLQQLPFELIDLVLQYVEWPLRENANLGMEVFLADTENAESLPRDKVLRFLEGIDVSLTLRYLEHIIKELDDKTATFHDRLINLYLNKLKQAPENSDTPKSAGGDSRYWQQKLEQFLVRSEQYSKSRILRELPQDDAKFFEARAIVLSQLGQHKQALQIYVYQMQDYQKAEEYCNQSYLSSTASAQSTLDPDSPDQSQSVYTTLLSLYLTPPSAYQANLPAALDLLSRHGSRLPALNTLSILPTSLPVNELESYFRGRMRTVNSLMREEAIVAALSRGEKDDWEAALLLGKGPNALPLDKAGVWTGRNRRVVIGENRLCPVCGKRFGRAAVRAYPDGAVVHYGCSDRRSSLV